MLLCSQKIKIWGKSTLLVVEHFRHAIACQSSSRNGIYLAVRLFHLLCYTENNMLFLCI